ncbi:protein adenylyltransferase SelO [Tabrizicola oligotrophica]|uniref:Protein nucleotidyltransferase YdiU n=1 Tax=Tabrizicola oligotrophica TaxID=2710650 RepID=A0A6M0QV29_9RHOB|nr:YdiU family protein [Tabrizicola oligotrophica]NEY91267.1 YdiU family protein [Tabrizicola oligotrophica]
MIRFDNSYLRDLPGTYLRLAPETAPAPRLLAWNAALAAELGLEPEVRAHAAAWFSGADPVPGADPAALAYAGHQFGGFSPQLGDGRAHLLGEVLDGQGRRWDIQLKGSGRTPFSRGGDGKAAVGPMLREYLISEAMAALGIPTTRSLAVVATGETVWRDGAALPGAVLARVAASHIRVGTFQFFAARGEADKLRALVDYTIARHYPQLAPGDGLGLFDAVLRTQAKLIAQWMGVGFVHGVMNTDNMALSGETIDYGPCAFMEAYAPGTVFSSIDRQGRYAYGNQPLILGWNLARLAECLLPFFDADEERAVALANDRLGAIAGIYREAFLAVMAAKLGLAAPEAGLVDDLLALMPGQDWTLFFRGLGEGRTAAPEFAAWVERWRALSPDLAAMQAVNPAVIPRNHLVEAALQAASAGDMAPFEALLAEVRRPFAPATGREGFALPAPEGFGRYVTFCGT